MEWKFKAGDVVTFTTVDSKLRDYNGRRFEVLRRLTDDEADLCETGPMYRLQMVGWGWGIDAYEDELREA